VTILYHPLFDSLIVKECAMNLGVDIGVQDYFASFISSNGDWAVESGEFVFNWCIFLRKTHFDSKFIRGIDWFNIKQTFLNQKEFFGCYSLY
jgi:hypothetical protein